MSNSNFITPRNRAAAASEEAFKKRVQTSIPSDSTNVVVFTDPTTEGMPELSGGYYVVRVYSEGGHHSHLLDPREATNKQEFRRRVLQLPQATLEADHESVSSLTNLSIWKAFAVGEKKNLFSLISVERLSSYSMNFSEDGSISKIMGKSGNKAKLSSVKRAEGAEIQYTYSDSKKDDLQKPQYSKFFEELKKRLTASSFSANKIQINSLTRDAASQARAMTGGRFNGPSDFSKFRSWVFDTYKGDGQKNSSIRKLVDSKTWQSKQELDTELTTLFQGFVDKGLMTGGHFTSSAADLRTNDLSFEDVMIIKEVLKDMKNDKLISSHNWEGIEDVKGNLEKRKIQGVFRGDEHLHIDLGTATSEQGEQ